MFFLFFSSDYLNMLVAMKLIIKFPSLQLWHFTNLNKWTSYELIRFYRTAAEYQLITNLNHKANYYQTCRFIHYLSVVLPILDTALHITESHNSPSDLIIIHTVVSLQPPTTVLLYEYAGEFPVSVSKYWICDDVQQPYCHWWNWSVIVHWRGLFFAI